MNYKSKHSQKNATWRGLDKMKINKIKMLGICALLTVVLTACGTKDATQEDTNQMVAQTDAGGDATMQTNAPRASMNPNAILMMSTFRGLIQMDQAEGLAITKAQAEPMVTIVQDAITKGELTAEVQTQLEANLTADQKKFLTENASKMPQRNGNGNGKPPADGTNRNAPQGTPNGDAPQGSPGPNGNGGGGFGGGGSFNNIGPQLLELLQAKLK
jgi:hypothetical protein